MSDQKIIEIYEYNLNMTLAELSRISGKPITYLKKILMSN